jgi:hypothetical protein
MDRHFVVMDSSRVVAMRSFGRPDAENAVQVEKMCASETFFVKFILAHYCTLNWDVEAVRAGKL